MVANCSLVSYSYTFSALALWNGYGESGHIGQFLPYDKVRKIIYRKG